MFAQIQIASAFAALGIGKYLKRLLVTQFSIVAVLLSYLGGMFVSSIWNDLAMTSPMFAAAIATNMLVASITSQLVFGFFRFTRGWRIHKKESQRGPAFSLHDLFALTLLAAVAISAVKASLSEYQVLLDSFFVTSILSGLSTLFYVVPTVATTFKLQETEQSLFAQLIIVVSVAFLIVTPFTALGANVFSAELLFLLLVCSMSTWLPLAKLRELGYVLTNKE